MSLLKSNNRKRISIWKVFLLIILFIIILCIFVYLRYQTIVKLTNIIIENQSSSSMEKISETIPSNIHSIRCIIYISRRYGRLGNRMFSIATGYAFARFHSCHLYLSPYIFKEITSIFIFPIQSIFLSERTFQLIKKNISHRMNKITKDIGCQYMPELIQSNGIPLKTIFELKGYWQTYLHFINYTTDIRENIFISTQSILQIVSKFFSKIYQENFGIQPEFSLENHQLFKKQLAQLNKTTWIGVHIRRTDFININAISSDQYLFHALEYYTLRYPNAYFIVASDDKVYCKKLFHNRSNIFLTPLTYSPGNDLITLSLCQHSIITGGTFGWWSAYLANGEVVYDSIYLTGCKKDTYYYPSWFKSDNDIILYKHHL